MRERLGSKLAIAVAAAASVSVSVISAAPAQAAPGWRDVAVPALEPESSIEDIAAGSPADAWAVGYDAYDRPTGNRKPLMLRWNGSRWARFQGFPAENDHPATLSATSPRDTWAHGTHGSETRHPYAWQWSGSEWKAHRLPYDGDPSDLSVGHQPLAAARGGAFVLSGNGLGSWVWRWNGTMWQRDDLPERILATAIAARTASDVWAIGSEYDDEGSKPAVLHWNGAEWQRTPATGLKGYLSYAFAESASSFWAIGSYDEDGTGKWVTYAAHWNGSSWMTSTVPASPWDTVTGITGNRRGRLWLSAKSDRAFQTMYFRYAAGRWTKVYGPERTDVVEAMADAMAAVPGTSSVWSAGSYTLFRKPRAAMIERYGS